MSRTTTAIVLAVGLWLAGALQQTIAPRITIAGAGPDFLLVALALGSMYFNRARSAGLGFACGVIHGALAGANLMHYAISRTVGGFLIGWMKNTRLEPNLAVAFATGFFLTLVCQILLMFLAPPRDLLPYLGATIGTAAYNGILVVPLYFLMKSLAGPPRP